MWYGAASLQAEIFNETDEESETAEEEDPTAERIPGMEPMPTRLELALFDRAGNLLCRHNEVR